MSKRIFISMSLLALLTILLSVVALTFIMFQQLSEDMERELKNQALYLRVGVSESGADYLAQIKGEDRESRITLIDPQGMCCLIIGRRRRPWKTTVIALK